MDLTITEGSKAAMPLLEPKHFIFTFLGHALGTVLGTYLASRLAIGRKMTLALLVGLIFFVGGVINVFVLPSPLWFSMVDLAGAYFPMAYFGGRLGRRSA